MAVTQLFGRVVATLALVSSATALPRPQATSPDLACGPAAVSLRDPPTFLNGTTPPGWTAPPTGWIFKPWNQVITSNTQAAQLRNFQWDPTPVDPSQPDGDLNDLSSFQIPGNDTVYTSYGVATPNPKYVAVLEYRGTGILENATSEYSWLGWGCDANRNEYYVSYSTASEASGTPAGIDVMSIVDTGLDNQTRGAIIASLKNSTSEEVRKIADTFLPNIQDGGRRDLGRINTCDDKCKTNEDLIGVIG